MADSPVTVNQLSWRDLAPCLVMFRALPVAVTLTVMTLSLFAVAATPIGWIALEAILVSESSELAKDESFQAAAQLNRSPWKFAYAQTTDDASILTILGHQLRGVELIFNTGVRSFSGVFSLDSGIRKFTYFLGGGLWTLLVWCFFGCAITRTALMRYAREEPIGIDDACEFAFAKFLSCVGGIGLPLVAIFCLALPIAGLGVLMTTDVGIALGGFFWIIVLGVSFLMALVLLVLMFAWPLIVSAISCEGQDSFDGMSRAFAYVLQRPLNYVIYALVAVAFSGICWLAATALVGGTIQTAQWAASWGMNLFDANRSENLADPSEVRVADSLKNPKTATDLLVTTQQNAQTGNYVARPRQDSAPDLISEVTENSDLPTNDGVSGAVTFGKRMVRFWNHFIRTLGAAFLYGLFWCLAAAIYLLLRKDLDATEMDEVYLADDRRTYELPPLKDDPSGVPQMDDGKQADASGQA